MGAVHSALKVAFLVILHKFHQMVYRHLNVVLTKQLILQVLVVYLERVVDHAVVAGQIVQANFLILA